MLQNHVWWRKVRKGRRGQHEREEQGKGREWSRTQLPLSAGFCCWLQAASKRAAQCGFTWMEKIDFHHTLLPNFPCLSYQVRPGAHWRRAESEPLVYPLKPKIHFWETSNWGAYTGIWAVLLLSVLNHMYGSLHFSAPHTQNYIVKQHSWLYRNRNIIPVIQNPWRRFFF